MLVIKKICFWHSIPGLRTLPVKTIQPPCLPKMLVLRVLLGLWLGGASTLSANDTTYGLQNGTFRFEKNPHVSLQKEVLTIGISQITVDYVFRNESAQPLVVPTVFPMPPMLFGTERGREIEDFKVFVDGQVLEPQRHFVALLWEQDITAQLRQQDWDETKLVNLFRIVFGDDADAAKKAVEECRNDWISRGWISEEGNPLFTLHEYFTWELELKPHQERSVRHTYRPSYYSLAGYMRDKDLIRSTWRVGQWPKKQNDSQSYSLTRSEMDDELLEGLFVSRAPEKSYEPCYLEYKLATGANWNGPIQEFTLIIQKPSADTVFTSFGNEELRSMQITRPNRETIVFHATRFAPRSDLRLLFAKSINSSPSP